MCKVERFKLLNNLNLGARGRKNNNKQPTEKLTILVKVFKRILSFFIWDSLFSPSYTPQICL